VPKAARGAEGQGGAGEREGGLTVA